jgi:hypothetical protein
MGKKTLKLVDPNDPAGAISPPRPLGKHGSLLWQGVLKEYDIADVGGREMLAQACAMLDRSEELRERSTRWGRGQTGLRSRSLKHELASRAFVVRACQLGLDVEPVGAGDLTCLGADDNEAPPHQPREASRAGPSLGSLHDARDRLVSRSRPRRLHARGYRA